MPNVGNGDIIRVTCKLAHASGVEDIQNVFHFLVSGGAVDDDVVHSLIAGKMEEAYTEILSHIPTTTTFETIETWCVSEDRPMVEDAWPTLTAGTGSGEAMPSQCSPLVLFNTETARSQGRKYLPFFRETDMTSGVLTSGAVSDMLDFASIILAGITYVDTTLQAGNWNKLLSRFATWVSAVAQDVVRTQRRRVRGVGS